MAYVAKNFDYLLGTPGFSDRLLQNHFTLYQGYVTNTNRLAETLHRLSREGKTGTPEFAELKRRFGWEFDGMRLHELYFGNMRRDGRPPDPKAALYPALEAEFGSLDHWAREFKAVGLMRGIGWAILYYDPAGDRLFNVWVNEHDTGHLAGCAPLLVMDVFEHAYLTDYGLKRTDYVEAFFRTIDWAVVEERFREATGVLRY